MQKENVKKYASRYKILSNVKKGKAFVVSAPAGTGKTTLVNRLIDELPHVERSISFTTRKPRKGEQEGIDYHFISYQEFEHKIKKTHFIEYAEVFGNFYGTEKKTVETLLNKGIDVVLVIDTQGALELKPFFDAVYIFVNPPSLEELERRLKGRETDSIEDVKTRLSWAEKEMSQAHHYDYNITNCDLEKAYQALKSIFIAEQLKTK
jgi:guanylate kinase